MHNESSDDTLVTIGEAADLLGVSVRTVARLQSDGTLAPVYPPVIRKARVKRYRRADVEALLTAAGRH